MSKTHWLAVFAATSLLLAQVETTTRISGVITDPSGASVPGVRLVVTNQGTGATRQGASDANGRYSFPSLHPGTYTITATLTGFKTTVVSDRTAQVAQPAEVDITMQVGELSQTVTVSAAGAELLTTTTAEMSGTIDPGLVENLPVQRQNMFDLALLTPGASPQDLMTTTTGTSFAGAALNFVQAAGTFTSSGLVLNGNRDSSANVSVDGANVQSSVYQQTTQLQSPSTILEMRTESGAMNAEFGSGVTAVNIITKSGGNSYHGELYESLRNNKLDATPFFTNLAGRKLATYAQNVFGSSFGGPVKKSKLLFFGNYEGQRVRQHSVTYESVPPSGVVDGDFSGVSGRPVIYNPYDYDPATGLRRPFPGNKMPKSAMDPISLTFLQKWVMPANWTLNGVSQYLGVAGTQVTSDKASVRVDFLQTAKTTIYGRWSRIYTPQFSGGVQPLEGTDNTFGSQNAVGHWTQILGARAVNDVMLAYTRPTWILGRNQTHGNVAAEIGLKNVGTLPGGPQFSVPGFSMDTATLYINHARENNYQFKDDLTISSGRHSIKFGAEVRERRFHYSNNQFDQGEFFFQNVWSAPCAGGNTACTAAMRTAGITGGGNALADYMLGATTSQVLTITAAPYAGYQRYYGPYAQDSWRATPRLTVNFGLRYEYWRPWLVPRNTTANWNEGTGQLQYALKNPLDYLNASACYGRCGDRNPGVPREAYRTGALNFAPRLGIAYLIGSSTVFRAGAGIFYDGNINNNQFSNITTGMAPFTLNVRPVALASDQLPTLLVRGSFPPPPPAGIPEPNANPAAAFRAVLPYIKIASVDGWSASLQRRFGSSWSVELGYVGSHTVHQPMFFDLNSARLPLGADAALSLQQRRMFPQWGIVGSWIPIGWARYHGGTVSAQNRPWHGLTLVSNATWAKNLSTSNVIGSDQALTNLYASYTLAGEAQISPRLRYVLGYTYDLPFGKGKPLASRNVAARAALGGWRLSGSTTFSTGSPQPVNATTDLTGTGVSTAYPDRICDPREVPGGQTRSKWFNTACFASAAFGRWPNSPMGAITAPGINSWNTTVNRSIRVHFPNEGAQLAIRAELYNAFNHTQWGAPARQYGASGFGSIGSTRPARQMQISLKYQF
jgi:hypothetical protein